MAEKMVNVKINGIDVKVPANYTIMQAADKLGIYIPRICFLKDISETSACRLCVVEIEGLRTLKNSCTVKVSEGMVVKTNTDRVRSSVVKNLQLLAGNHRFECWNCPREHNCEFLELLRKYNIDNVIGENPTFGKKIAYTNISTSLCIDTSKCILCGRCVSACEKLAGTGVLNFNNRGFATYVAPANNKLIEEAGCIFCGKCIQACPVGALHVKDDLQKLEEMLQNKGDNKIVVAIAPAVRASLGEEFGLKIGTNVEGKIYEALRLLGFDDITDINFGADLTIMEEASEFIERFKKFKKGEEVVLPMFTSCSPGWIRYIERYYPEYIPNLSSCKSPQQMHGAALKYFYEKEQGIKRENIKVVTVMPCIAKKYEANRPEMEVDGVRDIDLVITTTELARMIKNHGIDFVNLKNYKPQSPLAKFTGAGAIFGATGGVMEAALRTAKFFLEKEDAHTIDIPSVRGVEDIKEATVVVNGEECLVAVVHGGVNFPEMFRRIKESKKPYLFVEFMGCTGGCVNGGGQPIVNARIREKIDVRKERAKALYAEDKKLPLRRSHENPSIKYIYEKYFNGAKGKHLTHELLHTTYTKKQVY